MNVEQSVNNYSRQIHIYERFTIKVNDLLDELLQTHNINATLEHRTKNAEHFREKITRPDKSYIDPLNEITDLCGVRIIVRRTSEVLKVVNVIKNEFAIDDKDSVYKADELNVDQFGYTSVHLVVNVNQGRANLTEWRLFKELKVEIQVRTILQHAWAVISHAFDYKVGADIPREFRRRLFRLSALFELADEELDHLVEDIEKKIEKYRTSLSKGNTQIELNVDSLRTYIETATEAQYWIEYVRRISKQPVDKWGNLSTTIKVAKYCGLNSVEDLRRLLNSARGWGEAYFVEYISTVSERYHLPVEKIDTTINGVIGSLITAANAERILPGLLNNAFGFSPDDPAHSAAMHARGIDLEPPA